MSRHLLLPDGKPRRVIVSDSYDPTTGTHTNPRTLYLDDDEECPCTVADLHAMLSKEVALGVAAADPLDQIKSVLDSLKAANTKEALDWRAKRMESK